MKKYELLKEDTVTTPSGETLYRIKALVAIGLFVSPGDLGGYIENTKNLDMSGDAWVSGNAQVSGDAQVYGNARVSGNARVYGDAWVSGNARVSGNAQVKEKNDIQWFSNVGFEYGTLTVCKAKKGLFVSRGCFAGTLDEFKAAVSKNTARTNTAGTIRRLLTQSKYGSLTGKTDFAGFPVSPSLKKKQGHDASRLIQSVYIMAKRS